MTLVACGCNGVFADSDPVRFHAEVPGCEADFNADGSVDTLHVLAIPNAWSAGC